MSDLERQLAEINGLSEEDIYPNEKEKQAAQVLYTAIMTDTLIEEDIT